MHELYLQPLVSLIRYGSLHLQKPLQYPVNTKRFAKQISSKCHVSLFTKYYPIFNLSLPESVLTRPPLFSRTHLGSRQQGKSSSGWLHRNSNMLCWIRGVHPVWIIFQAMNETVLFKYQTILVFKYQVFFMQVMRATRTGWFSKVLLFILTVNKNNYCSAVLHCVCIGSVH